MKISILGKLNFSTFNFTKFVKFVTFGNDVDSVPDEIQNILNGKQLNRVTYNKYCGLMYDYNMKWNTHVANIVKKTNYLVQ